MRKFFNLFAFITILFSCGNYNTKLESALRESKGNRQELEKVLGYYSQNPNDSLKYKAAVFLIENMPGHYSYDGAILNKLRQKIYNDTNSNYYAKKHIEIMINREKYVKELSEKIYDIETIKADFLIKHIDGSFQILNSFPWLHDVSFENFCEYILPYRFDNEKLDFWRDSISIPDKLLQKILIQNNYIYSFNDIKSEMNTGYYYKSIDNELSKTLFGKIGDDCYKESYRDIIKHRIFGLPSAVEYVYYNNSPVVHAFVNIIDPPQYNHYESSFIRKIGKIYRQTYSHNECLTPKKGEYIPVEFRLPFLKDVTNTYIQTKDVTLDISKQHRNKERNYYLSVFDKENWRPIATTTLNNNKLIFRNVGPKAVYIAGYYHDKENFKHIDYPFVFNLEGKVEYIIPDKTKTQTLHLTRKFPITYFQIKSLRALEGASIEATNDENLENWTQIFVIDTINSIEFYRKIITSEVSYKYWQICGSDFDLNEIYFRDKNGIFITGKALYSRPTLNPELAFDNDILTHTRVRKWAKVEFEEPINPYEIIIFSRNDGNTIFPNDKYELLYFDKNGWVSCGEKITEDFFIEFHDVPTNALYWLKNKTKGVEEKIFTFKDGNVTFW